MFDTQKVYVDQVLRTAYRTIHTIQKTIAVTIALKSFVVATHFLL